jgi:hypothetical protein
MTFSYVYLFCTKNAYTWINIYTYQQFLTSFLIFLPETILDLMYI